MKTILVSAFVAATMLTTPADAHGYRKGPGVIYVEPDQPSQILEGLLGLGLQELFRQRAIEEENQRRRALEEEFDRRRQFYYRDRGFDPYARQPRYYGYEPIPQCFIERGEVWDGWQWIPSRRRICR